MFLVINKQHCCEYSKIKYQYYNPFQRKMVGCIAKYKTKLNKKNVFCFNTF